MTEKKTEDVERVPLVDDEYTAELTPEELERYEASRSNEPPDEPAPAGEERPVARSMQEIEDENRRLVRERDGMMRELSRERERRRLRDMLLQAEQERAGDTGAAPETPEDETIPVVVDPESGEYRVRAEDVRKMMTAARKQAAGIAPGAPETTTQAGYDAWRTRFIADADDPELARRTVGELEEAYRWLDTRTGRAFQEAGVQPKGLGPVVTFLRAEGVFDEFREKYPSIDPEELIDAPTDPWRLERVVIRHARRLASEEPAAGERPRRAEVGSEAPLPERRRGLIPLRGDRPRGMAGKGRAGAPVKGLERFADMTGEDVLSMSDEDFEDFKRQVRSQS